MNDATVKQVFTQAVANFPYPEMQRRGLPIGSLKPNHEGVVEYCDKYNFNAGTFCNERIEGCGWFLLFVEENIIEITMRAHFAREGEWEGGQLLPDGERLQGQYDLDTQQWTLKITPY